MDGFDGGFAGGVGGSAGSGDESGCNVKVLLIRLRVWHAPDCSGMGCGRHDGRCGETYPAPLLTRTIFPDPLARIPGRTALTVRSGP